MGGQVFSKKLGKGLNRTIATFMISLNGMSFRHVDLEGGLLGFYWSDGTHLSDIALDIFNLDIDLYRISRAEGGEVPGSCVILVYG